MSLESIYNFKLLTDKIATGGQPDEEELFFIYQLNYEVVVNLGLSNTEYSVQSEEDFFTERNILYYQIPVLFHEPKEDDLIQFLEIIEKHKEHKLFIHCAANKRVSAFMALY
ncbi:MAG: phosphatase, partial [Bacteroidota bacterium]